jgi:cytochrome c biogenesis protein CcdA
VFDRQKITGWILVVFSTAFILYFLKVRLLGTGPVLERKEWFQFIVSIVVLIIGTVNVRLAAQRAERRKGRPE